MTGGGGHVSCLSLCLSTCEGGGVKPGPWGIPRRSCEPPGLYALVCYKLQFVRIYFLSRLLEN